MLDNIHITGFVTVDAHHDDGRTVRVAQGNVLTNNGRDRIAALLSQDSTAFPDYIGIGTGSTAAAVTDTALGTEVDRNQVASRTSASGVATYRAFFSKSEANGNTIAEVGLFDISSGGTMFCRSVLASTVSKTSSISLTITWTLTFSNAT